MVEKRYVTYNQVHKQCEKRSGRILHEFKPNLIVAIGGGGYVPARILRSFLKKSGAPNIPIQAIGLSLYESFSSDAEVVIEEPGTKVTRTQWLDLSSLQMDSLIGKNILIVDEVDDTRTTLEYAVRELEKDVETARKQSGRTEKTTFFVFVLHNKNKLKKGYLPDDMEEKRYIAGMRTGDVWICYPWEATDIDQHDKMAQTLPLEEDVEKQEKAEDGKKVDDEETGVRGSVSEDIKSVSK